MYVCMSAYHISLFVAWIEVASIFERLTTWQQKLVMKRSGTCCVQKPEMIFLNVMPSIGLSVFSLLFQIVWDVADSSRRVLGSSTGRCLYVLLTICMILKLANRIHSEFLYFVPSLNACPNTQQLELPSP